LARILRLVKSQQITNTIRYFSGLTNKQRRNTMEGLVRAKPFEIVDIESTAKPFAPDKSFEIIE
jgi:hypothetical protein